MRESETDKEAAPAALKMKELIAMLSANKDVNLRPAQWRAALEAMGAALSGALNAGREVHLPALGKLRVVKQAQNPQHSPMTLKLKQAREKNSDDSDKKPLAPAPSES